MVGLEIPLKGDHHLPLGLVHGSQALLVGLNIGPHDVGTGEPALVVTNSENEDVVVDQGASGQGKVGLGGNVDEKVFRHLRVAQAEPTGVLT